MRCNKARYLIAIQQDSELSERQGHFLQAHLDSCAACRAFYAEISFSTSALLDDSFLLEKEKLSASFSASLSCALQQEITTRPSSAASYLDTVYEWLLPKKLRAYMRVATAAAALAVLWFVIAHFALSPQSLSPRSVQCRFGQLASFKTKASSDGRVFASLSERRSLDRDSSREVRLK